MGNKQNKQANKQILTAYDHLNFRFLCEGTFEYGKKQNSGSQIYAWQNLTAETVLLPGLQQFLMTIIRCGGPKTVMKAKLVWKVLKFFSNYSNRFVPTK